MWFKLNVKILLYGFCVLFFWSCDSQNSDNKKGSEKKEKTTSDTLLQKNDNRSVKEVMNDVGNMVIRNTPFAFEYKLQPHDSVFDFVKYVDFSRTYGKDKKGVAYAISAIESTKDTTMIMETSHNDGLKIWVNNDIVYKNNTNRKVRINPRERDIAMQDTFQVHFNKGINKILVKSYNRNKEDWIFYLQPKGALFWASPVKNLKIKLCEVGKIRQEVCDLANWLVIGPFPGNLSTEYPPEKKFEVAELYKAGNNKVTWELPKVELFAGIQDRHPLWGSYYEYNYHAAGVAWAMANLGKVTGKDKYINYSKKYCNFLLDKKPFIKYQTFELKGFRQPNHHMFETPLLDYKSAPAIPYVYWLHQDEQFKKRSQYIDFVENIKKYLEEKQVRLPNGTFTRETPKKYTTWVDDMYMGIPFLVHAAKAAKSEKERKEYFNKAVSQVKGFNNIVWDEKKDLYMHAQYSKSDVKFPYWSRANGWGIFAVSEVLKHLPREHESYDDILKHYKKHITSLLKYQDKKTGLWHNVLNKQDTYLEVSGSAIFTMALARGVNNGWLKKDKYHEMTLKAWNGIKSKIDKQGNVYDICMGTMCSTDLDYYKNRPKLKNDSHGLIGVIMAGAEILKMQKN